MNKIPPEINDDEIRVISSSQSEPTGQKPVSRRKWVLPAVASVAFLAILAAVCFFAFSKGSGASDEFVEWQDELVSHDSLENENIESEFQESIGFVSVTDTLISGVSLRIFLPFNLNPSLHIGTDILGDSTAKMVFPAADVRGDNGQILGAYVLRGELISKGQSKAGFCAITNGRLNIGVADATPMLEQAIETNGYFFRQFPLVVGGQIVENKPRNKSQRKALAEIDGEIAVVITAQLLTMHDFSECLVDLGVKNAIYLPGSTIYGFAVDADGGRHEFGDSTTQIFPNSNYIVWK